jgi:hypothetical protein
VEDAQQWLNATYPGRCISWSPLLRDATAVGCFPVEPPEGVRLCSPSRAYQIYHGKNSNCCDNGRCQHVKRIPVDAVRCTAVCL